MFKTEEHEGKLSELSQLLAITGVDQAKASLIIQELRNNYTESQTTISNSTKTIEDVNKLNEGLRVANMKLLSDLGTQVLDVQKVKEKPVDPKPEDKTKSIDELLKEF